MKNASNAAPYPHINAQPAYREAADKLAHFQGQLEIERANLVELQSEHVKSFSLKDIVGRPKADVVKEAEALIAETATRPLVERIHDKSRLIKALEVAVSAQRSIVAQAVGELSHAAGEHHREQHKATVRRLAAAVQELHDANKAEWDFRSSLERLGYEGSLLPMQMLGVGDPNDLHHGGIAAYWTRDARRYFMSTEEWLAEREEADAKARRDSFVLKLGRG